MNKEFEKAKNDNDFRIKNWIRASDYLTYIEQKKELKKLRNTAIITGILAIALVIFQMFWR